MKKRNKKNYKNLLIVVILLLPVIIATMIIFNLKNKDSVVSIKDVTKEINEHYNEFVKTNKETFLYNDKEEVGKIGNNVELTLNDIQINKDTKYFPIKNLEGYYIKYQDVDKIDSLSKVDDRYKYYIAFNENVVTNDNTSFYDENNNLIYSFNKSFDLPIIIKDEDRYGIEYNSRLLYVKKDDVKEVKNSNNTDEKNSTGIPVLNYHFAYEDDDTSCNEEICHSATQLKEHFSYIKDNNFFTPKMKELEMYIDKKIQLPQKSVVITFDDGGRAEVARKYVDEYKINATLFLITSWFNKDSFESEYFEVHSHGDDIHNGGLCPGGQGGEIKCMDHDKLLADLKLSREKLGGSTVFCYPFYEYNDYSIRVLKEAGFTMAFAGEYAGGNIKVVPGIDKFRLPRWIIVDYTTKSKFISYVNGGS
ncbi:MAG: polysaccharide deacetylase family protein [Bacilli bacterium]|nr:polysaccharide deacetylase family protein [Bacilli bacterium]